MAKNSLISELESIYKSSKLSSPNFLTTEYVAKEVLITKLYNHQREWDGFSKYQRLLLLSPRGHGKTFFWEYIKPIQFLLNDLNTRILLISKKEKNAQKGLRRIKRVFERNQKVKELYGDLKDEPWGQNAIFLRRPNDEIKDPSVEATCVLGSITGGRYDIIIFDDILDVENTWTEGRREKIKEWVESEALNTLERSKDGKPAGRAYMIGTRKHYADYYKELIEKPNWTTVVQKAILLWPSKYELIYDERGNPSDVKVSNDYKIFAPDMWNIKDLIWKRYDQGSIFFEREYQNNPSVLQGKILKRDWLHFYSFTVHDIENDIPRITPLKELKIEQAWDLAIGEKKTSHFTSCTTAGRNKHGNVYILDITRFKIPFPEQVKAVNQQAALCIARYKKPPSKILIESVAYQRALAQQALLSSILNGKPLPIVEAPKPKGSKQERFESMAPFFENALVRIHPSQDIFIEEWINFDPDGEGTDDTLDSTEIVLNDLIHHRTRREKGNIERRYI